MTTKTVLLRTEKDLKDFLKTHTLTKEQIVKLSASDNKPYLSESDVTFIHEYRHFASLWNDVATYPHSKHVATIAGRNGGAIRLSSLVKKIFAGVNKPDTKSKKKKRQQARPGFQARRELMLERFKKHPEFQKSLRSFLDDFTDRHDKHTEEVSHLLGVTFSVMQRFQGIENEFWTAEKFKSELKKHDGKFIACSAQFNTESPKELISSLKAHAKATGALIIGLPTVFRKIPRDKNGDPIGNFPNWLPILVEDCNVNNNLYINTTCRTIPTSKNPLKPSQGDIAPGMSVLIGHPLQHMKLLPTEVGEMPRRLDSTGSISIPNYNHNHLGMDPQVTKEAIANHKYGGKFYQVISDNLFHVRELTMGGDGNICDLGRVYTKEGKEYKDALAFYKKNPPTYSKDFNKSGLVGKRLIYLGDLHLDNHDPKYLASAVTAKHAMAKKIPCDYLTAGDLIDFAGTGSHHTVMDRQLMAKYAMENMDSVEMEYYRAYRILKDEIVAALPKRAIFKVVPSNHHPDHTIKWLQEGRYMKDSKNLMFGQKMSIAYLESLNPSYPDKTDYVSRFDPLEWYIGEYLGDKSVLKQLDFIKYNEGFTVNGVNCGIHSHVGINGARGSTEAFARAGLSLIKGHSHTPAVYGNVFDPGMGGILYPAYTEKSSLSTRAHGVVINQPNGTCQLLLMIKGIFCPEQSDWM